VDTYISNSPAETFQLGREWAREAEPGWVIGLNGELGAGKTQLVKGLADGMGVEETVTSPTFVLFHQYNGERMPLFHLDLYRLRTPEAVAGAGLDAFLPSPDGVTVVEWIGHWIGWDKPAQADRSDASAVTFPGRLRLVWFEDTGETCREITHDDFGA